MSTRISRRASALAEARAKDASRGTPRRHPWGSGAHIPVRTRPREAPFARASASAAAIIEIATAVCTCMAAQLMRGRCGATVGISRTSNAIPAECPRGASRGRRRTGMCAAEPQGRRLGVPREAPLGRSAGIADTLRKILPTALALAALALPAAARADLYYLIVGGLGGEQKYQKKFDEEVQRSPRSRAARPATRASRCSAASMRRRRVEKLLGSERAKLKATDSVRAVPDRPRQLRRRAYKINLPGPDIDGDELGKLLAAVPARVAADRRHDERERRGAREVGGRRPHGDHGDAQRLRAQRHAFRGALGGGAGRRLGRHRQERHDHGAGGVRLRVARGRRQLQQGRHARDRASAAEGRQGRALHVARLQGAGCPRRPSSRRSTQRSALEDKIDALGRRRD